MIDILLLLVRLLLCAVFVASALAKFSDQKGTRQAVTDFGAPQSFSRPIAFMLPVIEFLLGIGLIPLDTSRMAAAGMTMLLVIFTVVITISIVRGKRTVCHCFGESGNEPVSWWSVARNLGLGVLAILVAWPKDAGAGESVASLVGWNSQGSNVAPMISLVALAICACLTWAFINLFRRYGRLLLRIEELERGKPSAPALTAVGLPIGALIPQFAFPAIDGRLVSRDDLLQLGKPTLLVFSDPNCGLCSTLLPEMERWSADHAAQFALALVTRGDFELNKKNLSKLRVHEVLVEPDESLSKALSTLMTPSALVMQPSGRVGSNTVLGADGIRQLVSQLSSSNNGAT